MGRLAPRTVLAITALVGACGGSSEVELVVDLRTDLIAGVEFTSVRTRIETGAIDEHSAFRGEDYETGLRVAEFAGLAKGTRLVTISLLDVDGREVVERRVRLTQKGNFGLTVLISRDCAAITCPGPMDPENAVACVGGRCAPEDCATGTEPSCPMPECTTAADCPPAAACAETACLDGTCLYREGLALCGATEYCAIESGCRPLPEREDAGPGDAGVDAGSDAGADAGMCDESPCRLLLPQCGCPAGQMCQRTIRGDTFRECVPIGPSGTGEECANNLSCTTAHACVGISSMTGVCTPFCGDSADCAAGSECLALAVMTEPIGACGVSCDPVMDTGCPGTLGCIFLQNNRLPDSTPIWATACGGTGFPGDGSPCDMGILCAPGHICDGGTCRVACEAPSGPCAMGVCTAVPGAMVGGTQYGACRTSG